MQTRIQRRDVLITVVLLLIAFAGPALILWGISSLRLQNLRNALDTHLATVLPLHVSAATSALQVRETAKNVPLSEEGDFRWIETEYRGNGEHIRTPYASTIEEINRACDALAYDIKKDDRFTLGKYSARSLECAYIFESGEGLIHVSSYGVALISPEDIEHSVLIEALRIASSPNSYNIHDDEARAFHVLFQLQSDPLVIWSLRVFSTDDEG